MSKTVAAISAKNLTKTFGQVTVLERVNLDIVEGQTVALVGANGAGKTTLLRCLATLLRPTKGEVQWFGCPASAAARRLIGMVAHDSQLYPHLTLKENLLFAARMYGLHAPAARVDELLQSTKLDSRVDRMPTQISRGMRQRLALARAIIHNPPILLLDEPFASLDRTGVDWLVCQFQTWREKGRTVCFVAHDDRVVCQLADRVLRLQSGHIESKEFALQAA